MNRFFDFRIMITPSIIKVIFALWFIGCLLIGLLMIGAALSGGMDIGPEGIVGGLLVIVLGPLIGRIYCELVIVLFMVCEHLSVMRDRLERG